MRPVRCKFRAFQRRNRGTHATLTGSRLFSITQGAKGQPEVHLGDNKGTSEVHPGHTNHTDTLITQSTRSTKHTHNKATRASEPIRGRIAAGFSSYPMSLGYGGFQTLQLHSSFGGLVGGGGGIASTLFRLCESALREVYQGCY